MSENINRTVIKLFWQDFSCKLCIIYALHTENMMYKMKTFRNSVQDTSQVINYLLVSLGQLSYIMFNAEKDASYLMVE